MHIISKQGSTDNVLTYEHICDTSADMAKIDRKYITLGSVCIILAGESGAMEVYMADSSKEWHDILAGASSGGNTPSGLALHICTQNEVSNGKPNIEFPLETELYLVPSGAESGNLYDEYIWVNGAWELFGGANIDLTGYATQAWVSQQGYLSSFTETDPTVPAWAKAATKPTYTAAEVGALPADTQIPTVPTNISAFTNDVNYLSNPEATTMVENWLESNITTGNVIDASLTIEGAGADAKKTGDEISNLKSAITPLADMSLYNADLLTKGIVNSDGSITTANVYYVTPYIDVSGITDIYYSGYSTDYAQGRIYFYTSDKTPIKGYLPGIGGAILHIPETSQYVVFSVHSNDITNVKIQQFGMVSGMDVDLQDTKKTANFIQANAIQIIYSKNLFDKDSVVNGKYYNEDGLYRTNSNLCHSAPIEVEENAQYSCSPAQFTVSFFDKNGGFIGCSTANQSTFTTPIGCVRCVYNLLISQINTAMFNTGESVETYEPYTKSIKMLGATYDIIVAKDGSGQYTSVTDAVHNCASGSTIFVKNGVYENEEIDASNKTVYIYGQSREFTIIKNNTNNYASPPLEIAAGSVENLTLYEEENTSTGQVLAYACHIDYDYSFGRTLHFKNVLFKNDLYQAVGIGLRGNFNLIFDNCEFYSRDRVAFYMHDSVASTTKQNQNVVLHDCIIHSNGSDQTIRLVSYNQENANIDLTFIGCALANHGYPQVLFYFQDTQGEGGTQTRVYTIEELGNFHLNRLSYGNQLSVLNYPTT